MASTIFLRVPAVDWPAVKRGLKTEFRAGGGESSQLWNVECPTPVVAYAKVRDRYAGQLMLLEARWQEPLGAIDAESLAREGFASLAEFRRYWMYRERKRFTPTRNIFVYRVRPITPGDLDEAARGLLDRLYSDFYEPVEVAA